MQLWVETHAGTIVDNSSLVHFLWKNLSAEILGLNNQSKIQPSLVSYNSHYMTIIFPLTRTEINNIVSGTNNTVLQLYAPFMAGDAANIATGAINAQTINIIAPLPLWYSELGFTSPPPPLTSFSSIIPFLVWVVSSDGGRLLTLFSIFIPILYYTWKYSSDKKHRINYKDQIKQQKEMHETYRMVKRIHDDNKN